MFIRTSTIETKLEELNQRIERLSWMLSENKHNETVVIRKPKGSSFNAGYNKQLLDIIANRYKRLDHIAKAMKCTEKTVITYLKLARKDGYVIDCKRNKGQRPSYKLMKGVS